jgi:hypothetical protein
MRKIFAAVAVVGGVLAAVLIGTGIASAANPPMTHNMQATTGMTHN